MSVCYLYICGCRSFLPHVPHQPFSKEETIHWRVKRELSSSEYLCWLPNVFYQIQMWSYLSSNFTRNRGLESNFHLDQILMGQYSDGRYNLIFKKKLVKILLMEIDLRRMSGVQFQNISYEITSSSEVKWSLGKIMERLLQTLSLSAVYIGLAFFL